MTQKNDTECGFIPQAKSDNYFNSDHSEFVCPAKDLAEPKIPHPPIKSASSPIFRPRNNNPRYPDKNKSVIKAAFYAALERGRSIPNGSLLDREARRKWLAEHDIVPAEIRRQLPDGAAALLAAIALHGEGGAVEISNIELADKTGMHGRNVQRSADVLEDRALVNIERREQSGAKHLVNVYTVVSTALKRWIERFRLTLIGWRKRHGLEKDISISLKLAPKTAPKPAPKTLEETEIALHQAEPSAFDNFLLDMLAKVKPKRRLE